MKLGAVQDGINVHSVSRYLRDAEDRQQRLQLRLRRKLGRVAATSNCRNHSVVPEYP